MVERGGLQCSQRIEYWINCILGILLHAYGCGCMFLSRHANKCSFNIERYERETMIAEVMNDHFAASAVPKSIHTNDSPSLIEAD
ncbi:hypothetical protein AAHA92_09357 [Salvia divinorum]|uniref:Uncharacterized protein n=1 Tax=Salvia divinorum TaxID=28513 RepID=A0ABD1HRX8_SALDI